MNNKNMNLSQLILDADNVLGHRECILRDHTADPLRVVEIIDRRLMRAWNTEEIRLTIFHDGWRAGYDEHENYIKQYTPILRYVYEIDKLYTENCPPLEIEVLIKGAFYHNLDAFYAFLWYCERQINKYCPTAVHCDDATTTTIGCIDAAAAADAARWSITQLIANPVVAAAARRKEEINQIKFLRWCLGENQP